MTARLAKVRQAHAIVDRVCAKLLKPSLEALDSGAADLSIAVECIQRLEGELASAEPRAADWHDVAAEVRSMRCGVRQAVVLLQAAGAYYAGWARLLPCTADESGANYTAQGKSGPPIPIDRGRVVMHG